MLLGLIFAILIFLDRLFFVGSKKGSLSPLVKPAILVALLFRTMDAFRVFDQVFVMTAGGPGRSTQVLSFVIYLNGIRYRYLGYASAMSWIMLIIIIILAMLMIRLLRQVRI